MPLSQALGSRVGKRKKRKRRQHPRGLSWPAFWVWGPESAVAGVGGQEEGPQELLGRWKPSVKNHLETTILSSDKLRVAWQRGRVPEVGMSSSEIQTPLSH